MTGQAVSSREYQLTPDQQHLYRQHKSVVATPVTLGLTAQVGVLTCLAYDDQALSSPVDRAKLRGMADAFGAIVAALPDATAEPDAQPQASTDTPTQEVIAPDIVAYPEDDTRRSQRLAASASDAAQIVNVTPGQHDTLKKAIKAVQQHGANQRT